MATWTIASTFNVQVGTVTATDITVAYLAGADGESFVNDGTVDVYANTVRLNTSPTAPPGLQGEFSWNTDEQTADLVLDGATLQLGQETHWHVRNNSGATIDNGDAVMATGTIGASGRITIGLMDGSSIANAKYFLGIATEEILNGEDGKVTSLGKVRGIDTSAFNEGDVLWIDNATPGALTSTQPTTATKLPIAFVITKHATQGTIAVRATDGTYFSESHDVNLTSIAKGALIGHNGTNFANLAVGTNDQVLTADSTQSLGVKWANGSGGGGAIYRQSYFTIDLFNSTVWSGKGDIELYYYIELNRNTGNTNLVDFDFNDFLGNGTTPEFYINDNETIEEINFYLPTTTGIDRLGLVVIHWDDGNFPFLSRQATILDVDISATTTASKYFSYTAVDFTNANLNAGDVIYLFAKGTNLNTLQGNWLSIKSNPV